jgi:hypothetical protein
MIINDRIHNLSNIQLTPPQRQLLALGQKFILTPLPLLALAPQQAQLQILADFDNFARRCHLKYIFPPSNQANQPAFISKFHIPSRWSPDPSVLSPDIISWLAAAKNRLAESIRTVRRKKLNISKSQYQFTRQLRADPNIILKEADKNMGICVMTRELYEGEITRQLSDTETYGLVPADAVEAKKLEIFNHLRGLFEEAYKADRRMKFKPELVTDQVYNFIMKNPITPKTAIVPRIYILPKVHKPGPLKGRPLIPGHSWLTTPASKWLDDLLQPLLKQFVWTLTDSKALVNTIEGLRIDDKECTMMTADVESLYTKIPTNTGIKWVETFLLHHCNNLVPPAHVRMIIRILAAVLNNNYLEFNSKTFLQKIGTAMGTNVAVAFANIFMFMLERQVIARYKDSIILYRRLLDDILVILKQGPQAETFITALCNMNAKSIRLDVTRSETAVNFLDLRIYKGVRFYQKGILDLSVHEKLLNAHLYIPFSSCHTPAMKGGFIITELMRYVRNSSDLQSFQKIRLDFYDRLRQRGYPPIFLDSYFHRVRYLQRAELLKPKPKAVRDDFVAYFTTRYDALSANLPIKRILSQGKPVELANVKLAIGYKTGDNLLTRTKYKPPKPSEAHSSAAPTGAAAQPSSAPVAEAANQVVPTDIDSL